MTKLAIAIVPKDFVRRRDAKRHGDIRDLAARAHLCSVYIMNFVSPARNEAISRPEILWYIPLYYQQQHAYQFTDFTESAVELEQAMQCRYLVPTRAGPVHV